MRRFLRVFAICFFLHERAFSLSEYLKSYSPFVISNEYNQVEVLHQLAKLPRKENGVHIGWSIECNYKIMVVRRPKVAFLCDINSRVLQFHKLFKNLILSSLEVEEFLSKLEEAFIEKKEHLFANEKDFKRIRRHFFDLLMQEDDFKYLKKMFTEDLVHFLYLDVLDEEDNFIKLSSEIKENGYEIDTVYLSNLMPFAAVTKKKSAIFLKNLANFEGENSLFIQANSFLQQILSFKKVASSS